jgi:integration host factor subunit beta
MTKSELIEIIAKEQSHLAYRDVELAVKCMIEHMSQSLASGERIEIRGFGSFAALSPPENGSQSQDG